MNNTEIRRTAVAATLSGALVKSAITAGSAAATHAGEDGRLFFGAFDVAGGSSSDIFSVRPSGAGLKQLTEAGTQRDICPAISAGGRQVAFDVSEPGAPNQVGGIWGVDARSGRTRQLVPSPAEEGTWGDRQPAWSPNGKSVVFVRQTRQRILTATPAVVEFGAAWSPEGKEIAFTGGRPDVPEGKRYVRVMCADGGQRRVVVRTPGLAQAVAGWQPLPGGHHTTLTGGTR
jgi:Tol biopolymer transport system component